MDVRSHPKTTIRLLLMLGCIWAGDSLPRLLAQELGVDLRVVNETAPPGGLALIRVELTEPKPISSGRISLTLESSFLSNITAVAMLNTGGDLQFSPSVPEGRVISLFTSADATFGTAPEIPIMLIGAAVSPDAQPGQTMSISVDLDDSSFMDPDGQPYPQEATSGVVTVGGVCINDMTPSSGLVPAGSTLRFEGVSFEPGLDVNIEQADFGPVQLISSAQFEVTLETAFEILPTTRIRVRNPDGSEEVFYSAILTPPPGNTAPLAGNDTVVTDEDLAVAIDVMENDSDPNGDPLTVQVVTSPAQGSAQIQPTGEVLYTPDQDFHGLDSFSYTVRDNWGATATGLVTVSVVPVNDAPTAVDDFAQVGSGEFAVLNVTQNDFDVDGEAVQVLSLTQPAHGRAFLGATESLHYVPFTGFAGLDSFSYVIADPDGLTDSASVVVEIVPSNLSPVAVADTATTSADNTVEIPILSNDFDPEGQPLQVLTVSPPAHGNLTASAQNSSLAYTPEDGFTGADHFTYTISDGTERTASAAVLVAVSPAASELKFTQDQVLLVPGTSEEIRLERTNAGPNPAMIQLSSDPPGVIDMLDSVQSGVNGAATLRVFGVEPGLCLLKATIGEDTAVLPVAVIAGASLQLPVLRNNAHSMLGLAFTNAGSRQAQVRIRAFAPTDPGLPVEVFREVELEVPASQQTTTLLNELDPAFHDFSGWLEISSMSSALATMFLNVARAVNGFAGSSVTERTTRTALAPLGDPLAEEFEIFLLNNNPRPAKVQLDWISNDGANPGTALEIPAMGHYSASFLTLFPFFGNAPLRGTLHVQSDQPLNAYQQVVHPDYLWGTAPGAPSTGEPLSLPHFASGEGWLTLFSLSNFSAAPAQLSLNLFPPEHSPSNVDLTLAANSCAEGMIGELFGLPPSELKAGSLAIRGPGQLVGSALIRGQGEGSPTAAVPMMRKPFSEAIFAQAVSGRISDMRLFTGLALQNRNSDDAALIRIDVRDSSGVLRGSEILELLPNGRTSLLLVDLFPNLGPLTGGYLHLRSSTPIAALEIFGDFRLSFLSTVVPTIFR